MFSSADRMSRANASPMAVSATLMATALAYIIASLLSAPISRRIAPAKVISAGAAMAAVASAGFIFAPALPLIYLWSALCSFGVGIYCAPFEVYMNIVAPKGHNLCQSTASYTFAWSFGIGIGPLLFALVPNWQLGFAICAVLATITAAGIIVLDRYCRNRGLLAGAEGQPDLGVEYAHEHRHIGMAWLAGFAATVCLSLVRVFEPYKFANIGLSTTAAGCLMTLLCLAQCITVSVFYFFRRWMYNPLVLLALGIMAIAGMVCYWLGTNLPVLLLGSLLTGLTMGGWYHFFTFHALVDTQRAPSYAAINETLVGIATLLSPWLGQLAASPQNPGQPFLWAALVAALPTIAVPIALFIPLRKHK